MCCHDYGRRMRRACEYDDYPCHHDHCDDAVLFNSCPGYNAFDGVRFEDEYAVDYRSGYGPGGAYSVYNVHDAHVRTNGNGCCRRRRCCCR